MVKSKSTLSSAQRNSRKLEKRNEFLRKLVAGNRDNDTKSRIKTATRNQSVKLSRFAELLTVGEMANDDIIMNYCYQLEERDPEVLAVDSQWLRPKRDANGKEIRTEAAIGPRVLRRLKGRVVEQGKRFLLAPINLDKHWTGILVDISSAMAYYVDSLNIAMCRKYAEGTVMPVLRQILPCGDRLQFLRLPTAQQDTDGNSCGIYVLTSFRRIFTSLKKSRAHAGWADMERAMDEQKERLNIAAHLLFGIYGCYLGESKASGYRPFDMNTVQTEDLLMEEVTQDAEQDEILYVSNS